MVLSVGCYRESERVIVYDSETKIEKTFTVDKIELSNIGTIVKFFESLKKCVTQKTIDFLCILMNYEYTTEYRKTFLENAQQFGIINVRIIGSRMASFIEAINALSFTPKTDDNLWIFYMQQKGLFMDAWKFDEIKKWKCIETLYIKKIDKTNNKNSTIECLLKIKEQLKINPNLLPYVFCYGLDDINENDFAKVFPFKKLIFCRHWDSCKISLNYARYLSGENDFRKFESQIILDRSIYVKVNNAIIRTISCKEILPFSTEVLFDGKQNDIITSHENNNETFSTIIKERKEKFEIVFSFDINGIHTFNLKRCSMDQNEGGILKNIAKHFFSSLKTDNLAKNNFNATNDGTKKYNIPIKISEFDASLNAVGIDLGTTECCAAVIRKNGPDFVVLDPVTSLRTMPSYIAFDEKKHKCGQIVVDRMRQKAKYSIFDIKRIIGKQPDEIVTDLLWPFKVLNEQNQTLIQHETVNGTDTKSPEEITAVLLGHIKEACEIYQGEKISEAVIAIPSEFSEAQKNATRNAVEYAGFEKIHFIPEPIAAAFAYFSEIEIPNQSNILICDCGGGTVDICIATKEDDHLTVLSCHGDSHLGGRDFDKVLFHHFNAVLKHKFGIDVTVNNKKYVLKQKCQDIKHTLSARDEDWIDVSDFDPDSDDIIKISREEFETMTTDLLLKIKNVILQAIIKAKIEKQEINYVFQVGGGCRMPMIKSLLADIFPAANHRCNLYPDWVVAHGAALYAYFLKQNGN